MGPLLTSFKPGKRVTQITVRGRTGYCGTLGRPMLVVPLKNLTALNVTAPCPAAKQLAANAVARLKA